MTDELSGASSWVEGSDEPHRRYNPLTRRWTLVSVGRTKRPWSGRVEPMIAESRPTYEADCYLCPGNSRVGGDKNPVYETTYVFTNDFSSLLPDTSMITVNSDALMRVETVRGTCRVICYTPRHDLTLSTMTLSQMRDIVELWADQVAELGAEYEWVQVFENRGETMGASNPHPHGQVWASSSLPSEPAIEQQSQIEYWQQEDSSLLVDYAAAEIENASRLVVINDDWVAIVPFWASWPFETILMPRRSVSRLTDLSDPERGGLAAALSELLGRYDNLFEVPFPYSMGWHGAPGRDAAPHWQLHAHFYPPLLRSSVQKFMVGYEMLAEAQRDLSPEEAAERLRLVSAVPKSVVQ